MKTPEKTVLPIPTRDGTFLATYSRLGLASLDFPTARKGAAVRDVPAEIRCWHKTTTRAVKAVVDGQSPGSLPPLDLSKGTKFQLRVWQVLRTIPPGETRSYGQLARALGVPGAARAVGGACGANPIPVLVPCHRVLAAHHALGGFSGGLKWKRRLLAREGAWPDRPPC